MLSKQDARSILQREARECIALEMHQKNSLFRFSPRMAWDDYSNMYNCISLYTSVHTRQFYLEIPLERIIAVFVIGIVITTIIMLCFV